MPKHSRKNLKVLDDKGIRNPKPEGVVDEQFAQGDSFFDARDIVQVKYEMLRRVANGQSIDDAIRAFGFSSRQSFYRARVAFEQKGLAGLMPAKRGSKSTDRQQKKGTGFPLVYTPYPFGRDVRIR